MRKIALCIIVLGLSAASEAADQVVLTNAGADAPVVLVDAAYDDCQNDTAFSSASPVDIGDASEAADCDAEIVVFSDANAIAVVENPGLGAGDDTVTVALSDRWSVPLRYWVITAEPVPAPARPALEAIFKAQAALADQAYNESHAGISFAEPSFQYQADATWAPEIASMAQGMRDGSTQTDVYFGKLAQRITPLLNTINVYVVESDDVTGFHVSLDDGRSSGHITMGLSATMSTLAHELGHALTLDHINFVGAEPLTGRVSEYCVAYGDYVRYDGTCDYAETNLMWAGQDGPRNSITEGQAFRTSINGLSYVNGRTPPIRPVGEVQRECADWLFDRKCPYLALDK